MFLEYCADGDLKDYMAKKEEKRLSEVTLIDNFISLKLWSLSNILSKDLKDCISRRLFTEI